MHIEQFRQYCLSKPMVTEEFPFDESTLVFKVCGKMFALTGLENPDSRLLPEPKSPYAITKLDGEYYCEMFSREGKLDTAVMRYFNVFGPRQDPNGAYAAVIPKWTAALIDEEQVFINGDGETSRDFCFIDNVVQMNILAATSGLTSSEVFNVALNDQTTLTQLYDLLRDNLAKYGVERSAKPEYRDFRAGDVRHSRADITKAETLLGYAPQYNIGQGLALAMPWYIEQAQAKA